jgi:hypothetical protein
MRKQLDLAVAAILVLFNAITSGQTIPDIRDSLPVLEPPDPWTPLTLAPYVVAILILALLIWLMRRARSGRYSGESAEDRAHRRLASLAPSTPRLTYTELHSIFIEYLESRVLVKASRCTTPELLDVLSNTRLLSENWYASVEVFLADCDRAKFSSSEPVREPDAAAAGCRTLIGQIAGTSMLVVDTGRRR